MSIYKAQCRLGKQAPKRGIGLLIVVYSCHLVLIHVDQYSSILCLLFIPVSYKHLLKTLVFIKETTIENVRCCKV